jgi:hypothetical protein
MRVSGEFGNTQVTCHVGVPSCGQRHRNVFITYLFTYTISNAIPKSSPRLASMRRARLGPFFHFPTHPLLYYHLTSYTCPTPTW